MRQNIPGLSPGPLTPLASRIPPVRHVGNPAMFHVERSFTPGRRLTAIKRPVAFLCRHGAPHPSRPLTGPYGSTTLLRPFGGEGQETPRWVHDRRALRPPGRHPPMRPPTHQPPVTCDEGRRRPYRITRDRKDRRPAGAFALASRARKRNRGTSPGPQPGPIRHGASVRETPLGWRRSREAPRRSHG